MVKRNKFLRKKEGTQQTFVGLEDVLRTSSSHVLDVFNVTILRLPRRRKRLEDVLKTFGQDEYIGFHQDVFWRRKAKANIFVLIITSSLKKMTKDVFKTSSRCLYQDEYLLGNYYKHVNFVQKKGKKEEFRNFRIKEKLILWISGG